MRIEIFFKNFRRSEYVENFIYDKIESLSEKMLETGGDLQITVRVEEVRQRTHNRRPAFRCEVTLNSGYLSRPIIVVKQDRNIFRAIVTSIDTLKVLVGKLHKRLRHDHKRRVPITRSDAFASDMESFSPPTPAQTGAG